MPLFRSLRRNSGFPPITSHHEHWLSEYGRPVARLVAGTSGYIAQTAHQFETHHAMRIRAASGGLGAGDGFLARGDAPEIFGIRCDKLIEGSHDHFATIVQAIEQRQFIVVGRADGRQPQPERFHVEF